MKESDLYLPLKRFLESQHYEVKSEIQNCDVLAIRGEEAPVIVELKLSLNLAVVLQAVERLSLSPKVYIAVPSRSSMVVKKQKHVIKLLKMLGLGLILINEKRTKEKVKIALDPGEYRPRKSKYRQQRLLGEFFKRVGDPNLGGQDKKQGTVTAYRQRALAIALYLRQQGPSKAQQVALVLDDSKARDLLYRDHYGWFDRVGLGIYALSPRGECETPLPAESP